VRHLDRFSHGEFVAVQLLSNQGPADAQFVVWGESDKDPRYRADTWFRGRVSIEFDDAPPVRCYFWMGKPVEKQWPIAIGGQIFDFVAQWEAQDRSLNPSVTPALLLPPTPAKENRP
jgi:hypothetical protein